MHPLDKVVLAVLHDRYKNLLWDRGSSTVYVGPSRIGEEIRNRGLFKTGASPSALVTPALKRLIKRGEVVRATGCPGRSRVQYAITEAGIKTLAAAESLRQDARATKSPTPVGGTEACDIGAGESVQD